MNLYRSFIPELIEPFFRLFGNLEDICSQEYNHTFDDFQKMILEYENIDEVLGQLKNSGFKLLGIKTIEYDFNRTGKKFSKYTETGGGLETKDILKGAYEGKIYFGFYPYGKNKVLLIHTEKIENVNIIANETALNIHNSLNP